MMSTDGTGMAPTPHIKKEEEPANFQACSPSNSNMYSPTTTVLQNDVSIEFVIGIYHCGT